MLQWPAPPKVCFEVEALAGMLFQSGLKRKTEPFFTDFTNTKCTPVTDVARRARLTIQSTCSRMQLILHASKPSTAPFYEGQLRRKLFPAGIHNIAVLSISRRKRKSTPGLVFIACSSILASCSGHPMSQHCGAQLLFSSAAKNILGTVSRGSLVPGQKEDFSFCQNPQFVS